MIARALCALAAIGLLLALVQAVTLRKHLRAEAPWPRSFPFVSILKPLCGLDDALWGNLRSFARLRYPAYEILLGVKDVLDPAWPLALRAQKRWPHLVRVVVQRGAPGLNPKVNQLITLEKAARGGVLVVSDSNVRVRPGYLLTIAGLLDDREVGLVSHAVAGAGERSLGALLDNLTMCGSIAPGVVSAKRIARQDLVVGKSMALRRADLRALGGFERLKDVLAEDYFSGRLVKRDLGKRVALAPDPVLNVTRSQTLPAFFSRYLRWSVMQRKVVGNAAYSTQILLNPVALAAAAFAAAPERWTAAVLAAAALARTALHECSSRALRGRGFSSFCLLAPLADLIVACTWAAGLVRSEINWRGTRLLVREGTRLEQVEGLAAPERPLEGVG